MAKATAKTSKTAVSTYLGQRGVMTGRMLTPDVCFHLLPRLSLSGRCGLPRLSLQRLTRCSLSPCFTSHSPRSCKYALRHVDPRSGDVRLVVNIGDLVHWAAVHSHPQLDVRKLL